MTSLTPEDIQLVQKTWAVVYKNAEDNGATILKTFLDKHDYYYKFERFKDAPRENIKENAIFRNHCLRLMQFLNAAIETLDEPEKLGPMLLGLGEGHAKRKIQKQQFEHLRVVILDILVGAFKINDEEKAAWTKTFDVAFPFIFDGLSSGAGKA